MQWPEKPTCHRLDVSPFARQEHMVWRTPDWRDHLRSDEEVYQETWRTCGYCGSIHPEDLTFWLQNGAQLHGCDWKYSWPHKFYVEGIPNPMAGKLIPQYTTCGIRDRLGPNAEYVPAQIEPYMRSAHWREKTGEYPAPTMQSAKWYNQHFQDEGYDAEAFSWLKEMVFRRSGIAFDIVDGKLRYAAPYRGYQV